MESSTEILRKLLDERGVEWVCYGYENHTWWNGWHAENRPRPNGLFVKVEGVVTPEQAIAATLGSDAKPCYATGYTHERCKYSVNRGWVENVAHGTLTAEQVREAIEEAKNELLESCEYVGDMYQRQSDVLRAFGKMEQAIADELNARADLESEPPYDELLRCLENDWNISASWDGLRKFWCIELTEEGVKLRDSLNEVADKWASEKIKAEDYARENMMLKANNGSRWHELFGTPERAARTLHELCGGCCGLPERIRDDYDALLEWLGGDAE